MSQDQQKNLTRGALIVFEGIDGTGKSTQLQLLATYLQHQGYQVVTTREPTDGQYGRKIRELFINRVSVSQQEELELFICDRKEHVSSFIQPHLAQKKVILCDRYYLSTIAYQGAAGGEPVEIEKMNTFAPEPDIALLLDLPPEISIKRITHERGDALNDFEQLETLQRVALFFSKMRYPFIRHIDAQQPIEDVHKQIINSVTPCLNILNEE